MNYTEYVERLDKNLKSNATIAEKDCVFHDIRRVYEIDIYGLVEPYSLYLISNKIHRD